MLKNIAYHKYSLKIPKLISEISKIIALKTNILTVVFVA